MSLLLEDGSSLLLEDGGALLIDSKLVPFAVYPMGSFGNDTVGNFIWEKTDVTKDLTLGDGFDTDTFPTFVSNAEHETEYYSFNGMRNYLGNWPTMPEEYTVVAVLSDSYPGGEPYFLSCNNTVIQELLATEGGYFGNVHSLAIFDTILSADELATWEQRMMSRLWRDTLVDPFTARLIKSEECVLCLYCEEQLAPRHDYSENNTGSTDYSTVWDLGITFPVSGSAILMDADAVLNLDVLTIFIEAPNFDTEASAETILENGAMPGLANYVLSISLSAGICTVTLNGSSFSFSATGHRTLAVSAEDGEKPLFYLNGQYAGEGSETVTLSTIDAWMLTIGNNTARNNPFASTLKKLSIYSRVLTPAEIRAAHIMSSAERPFTT